MFPAEMKGKCGLDCFRCSELWREFTCEEITLCRDPQLSKRKHQDLGVAHEQIRAPATWSNSFASQGDAYLGISCWPCARMKTMVWKYLSHFPARYIVDDFSVTWDAGEPQLVAEFVWLHEPLCSQGEGEARLLLVVRAHGVSLLCLSKGSWVDG